MVKKCHKSELVELPQHDEVFSHEVFRAGKRLWGHLARAGVGSLFLVNDQRANSVFCGQIWPRQVFGLTPRMAARSGDTMAFETSFFPDFMEQFFCPCVWLPVIKFENERKHFFGFGSYTRHLSFVPLCLIRITEYAYRFAAVISSIVASIFVITGIWRNYPVVRKSIAVQ